MIIFEIIAQILAETILGNLLFYFFRGIRKIGLWALKALTFNALPFEEFDKKNKDSSKPYWLGFALFFIFIYFLKMAYAAL